MGVYLCTFYLSLWCLGFGVSLQRSSENVCVCLWKLPFSVGQTLEHSPSNLRVSSLYPFSVLEAPMSFLFKSATCSMEHQRGSCRAEQSLPFINPPGQCWAGIRAGNRGIWSFHACPAPSAWSGLPCFSHTDGFCTLPWWPGQFWAGGVVCWRVAHVLLLRGTFRALHRHSVMLLLLTLMGVMQLNLFISLGTLTPVSPIN